MDANTFQGEALRLEGLMYTVSRSLLRSEADCADAVQEALFRAWQKRRTLRRMEDFRPWLMRILVNCCRDTLRRGQRHPLLPLPEELPQAERFDPLPVRAAVDALPPEERLAVTLHLLEGYTVIETARMSGLTVGAVKSRLKTARRRLAALLQDTWEEEP